MSVGDFAYTLSFYLFGALATAAALAAVASSRILRAAIGLAVTLACTSAFYGMMRYDFTSAIQVLVYIGGIVVLIVYAIMLTSSSEFVESRHSILRRGVAAFTAAGFLVVSLLAIRFTPFEAGVGDEPIDELTRRIGRTLLNNGAGGYTLAFEIISLLLLAAVIGAIVLARKERSSKTDSGIEHRTP